MNIFQLKIFIRSIFASLIRNYRNLNYRIKRYDVDKTTIFERKLHLDRLYPQGIHIGEHCLIASGCTILSHDHCKRVNGLPLFVDTYVGNRCFIAVNATILPGVKIGNECIVGAGAVVTRDVPSNCIVAGNPAKIIRKNIRMNDKAELINWKPKELRVD
jgi:acetyltransferase-like isoleucine patch superfamily enzyme